jgi:hypothetical protein
MPRDRFLSHILFFLIQLVSHPTRPPWKVPTSELPSFLLASEWKESIFENLLNPGVISKANLRGYLDYKHLFYGNQDSGPLPLKVLVKKTGYLYLCEGPSVFGKLANGFTHLWESSVEIYKTEISEKLFHQLDQLVNRWTQYSFDKGTVPVAFGPSNPPL